MKNILENVVNLGTNKCLVFRPCDSELIYSLARSGSIDGIMFDGQYAHEIDFSIVDITAFYKVKALYFSTSITRDISFIENFSELEYLTVYSEVKYKSPDWSKLLKLRDLNVSCQTDLTGLVTGRSLNSLMLMGFRDLDMSFLNTMKNLNELTVVSRKVEDIGLLKDLGIKKAFFVNCTRLSNFSGLRLQSQLLEARFHGCKRIYDFSFLSELLNLKIADIMDCGNITGFRAFDDKCKLEVLNFYGETNYIENDLSFLDSLSELKDVLYARKRNYSVPDYEDYLKLRRERG